MKKLVLYSLLVTGLLFTAGCSQKEVDANNSAKGSEDSAQTTSTDGVKKETVTTGSTGDITVYARYLFWTDKWFAGNISFCV